MGNPGPNIPGAYQTEDNSRMNNLYPNLSGDPTNLPYPTQTPSYPSYPGAPPDLQNQNQQQFYPQANQPSFLPYPVEGQPVHLQFPTLPEPQVHQEPYQYPPNFPGQLPYPPMASHLGLPEQGLTPGASATRIIPIQVL